MMIKEAVKNFENTQRKFSSFGASDTEPDGIFQSLLRRAANDKEYKIPYTADGWELYSDVPGAEDAAKELGDAAKQCVDLIVDAGKVVSFVKSYCWR